MSTTDTTKHTSQSVATTFTHDPSPLEMDAETFYHLGMLGGGDSDRVPGGHPWEAGLSSDDPIRTPTAALSATP